MQVSLLAIKNPLRIPHTMNISSTPLFPFHQRPLDPQQFLHTQKNLPTNPTITIHRSLYTATQTGSFDHALRQAPCPSTCTRMFCVPALCLEHTLSPALPSNLLILDVRPQKLAPLEAFLHFLRGNSTLDAHGFTCLGKICRRHRHMCACFIHAIHTNVWTILSSMRINKITYFWRIIHIIKVTPATWPFKTQPGFLSIGLKFLVKGTLRKTLSSLANVCWWLWLLRNRRRVPSSSTKAFNICETFREWSNWCIIKKEITE